MGHRSKRLDWLQTIRPEKIDSSGKDTYMGHFQPMTEDATMNEINTLKKTLFTKYSVSSNGISNIPMAHISAVAALYVSRV